MSCRLLRETKPEPRREQAAQPRRTGHDAVARAPHLQDVASEDLPHGAVARHVGEVFSKCAHPWLSRAPRPSEEQEQRVDGESTAAVAEALSATFQP